MRQNFKRHVAVTLAVMMTVLFIPTTSFAADVADDIKYSIDAGDEADFDEDDFNKECEDLTGETLDYVKFDLPSSSKGILYYDYDGSDEVEVDDSDKYDYGDELDDVSFVPKDGYSGTVTISYEGCDTDGNDYTGDIKITVDDSGEAGDIKYSVNNDDTTTFDEGDFNDVCQDLNDADLDYVNFTLPSSTKGTLYFDYDGSDEAKV
ncbi:MAG TPA: hypothetical protein VM577_18265, partial [Anaerovoracaceae bacterium]|nr:hypothetical protein [Anaerovoracaceae bacterium]